MRKNGKIVAAIAVATLVFGNFASCSKKGESAEKPAKEKKTSKGVALKENPASDFSYTMTDDGQGVLIKKYIGSSPKIIIPATIEGLPVLEVEDLADLDHEYGDLQWDYLWKDYRYPKNNVTITHISFPDSVRHTGNSNYGGMSLYNYDALEYIKFPAGIETHPATRVLGPLLDAVTGKQTLESSIPSVGGCDKLNKIIIPEGIKVLPSFQNCKALKSITLPSTVEVIPNSCFEDCTSLEEIIIPETITKITFDTKTFDEYWGEENIYKNHAFKGTHLNLATQAKLKQLGYNGKF
ncbi:leucine-rich repeat protein [uncultured Treponema sp.]|uniref:leucine-rich repeat protein n=1 Tax=uncultured Treponema sp. TaxID=162155 RepID=UPI002591BBE9|nr:leucine-rich repeat protein [uncultured Treponema sp.]